MIDEIYCSTDVESDGPIPGEYSMLSFATVAFSRTGEDLGAFTRNLWSLAKAKQHPDTMAWWGKHNDAWRACREDTISPTLAMRQYVAWIKGLPGKPVFVAYPAGYDWTFMYWYLMKFAGQSPFGFQSLDMKSYAMAKLDTKFRDTTKRHMPKAWFRDKRRHTHIALDDAREQGQLFIRMLTDE